MKKLVELAMEGDAWAIVLYEWLHFYPHIAAEEVADVLALCELDQEVL